MDEEAEYYRELEAANLSHPVLKLIALTADAYVPGIGQALEVR